MNLFQEKEKGYFLKIDSIEIEKFWRQLHEFATEQVTELLAEDGVKQGVSSVVSATVKLLQFTTMFHIADRNDEFTQTAVLLNEAMSKLDTSQKEVGLVILNLLCSYWEYFSAPLVYVKWNTQINEKLITV